MILSAHQPNFIPYLGFFYKAYLSDVFLFSDNCKYSASEFQNYNYLWGKYGKSKITLPIRKPTEVKISELKIFDPEKSIKKIFSRICMEYRKRKFYDEVISQIESLFEPIESFSEFNIRFATKMFSLFGVNAVLCRESEMPEANGNPSEQIVFLCKMFDCNNYLSGIGGKKYLDSKVFEKSGVNVLWSEYTPVEYGSLENLSVIDYIFKRGFSVPDKWKYDKESLYAFR